MLQNLRAYFILYAITIKWIMRVQERTELSSMSHWSQRPTLNSTKNAGDLYIATKIKQQQKLQKSPLGGKTLANYFPGVVFATHLPIAMGMPG